MEKEKSFKLDPSYIMSGVGFLLGLAMIIWSGSLIKLILQIIGWFLIVYGALPVLTSLARKKPIPYISFIIFIIGIFVLLFQGVMQTILMWILGVVILLSAVQQINMLSAMKKEGYNIKVISYIYPFVLVAIGVLSIIDPFEAEQTLITLFGCGMIFYSITTIISRVTSQKPVKVYDIEAEEVKTNDKGDNNNLIEK